MASALLFTVVGQVIVELARLLKKNLKPTIPANQDLRPRAEPFYQEKKSGEGLLHLTAASRYFRREGKGRVREGKGKGRVREGKG